MPQSCTVCRHEKRDEIDRELIDGKPFRHIAARFGTSTSALLRHKAKDIPIALSKAHEVAATNYGDDLFSHVKDLNRRTLAILQQAEISGDPRTALAAIREARGNSELPCKMILAAEASKRVESSPETIVNILRRRREKYGYDSAGRDE